MIKIDSDRARYILSTTLYTLNELTDVHGPALAAQDADRQADADAARAKLEADRQDEVFALRQVQTQLRDTIKGLEEKTAARFWLYAAKQELDACYTRMHRLDVKINELSSPVGTYQHRPRVTNARSLDNLRRMIERDHAIAAMISADHWEVDEQFAARLYAMECNPTAWLMGHAPFNGVAA